MPTATLAFFDVVALAALGPASRTALLLPDHEPLALLLPDHEPLALPRDYAALVMDPTVFNNKSGVADFPARHREILSDPNNLFLPRCKRAGEVLDNQGPNGEAVVLMHNGVAVTRNGYYGDFSDVRPWAAHGAALPLPLGALLTS